MTTEEIFIQKGSVIKVYFKNGSVAEGMVLFWNDKKGLLCTPDGSSRLIIYHPAENVMMVKFLPQDDNEPAEDSIVEENLPVEETTNERAKRIAEYRLSQISQEKKAISKLLTSKRSSTDVFNHKQSSGIETKYYESPNFAQRQSLISSSKKNS